MRLAAAYTGWVESEGERVDLGRVGDVFRLDALLALPLALPLLIIDVLVALVAGVLGRGVREMRRRRAAKAAALE